MMARSFRGLGVATFALAMAALGFAVDVAAQGLPPQGLPSQGLPPQGLPPGVSANSACVRLEGQLAALDRGSQDGGRNDQLRRYEDAAAKQQAELDRVVAQGRRTGCEGSGFFSLFSGQSPQCGPLNNQIQQMRANLDRMLGDLERLKGGATDSDGQRRALLISLAQNNCGPQYRAAAQAAQPRNMFDALFGPGNVVGPSGPATGELAGTYRTLCVRTCDGFYFPISYSTVPSKFPDDERVCQRMCPAAEATLYAHRNPGEDVAQAVSTSGQPYSSMPNAFRYRKEFNAACSCKAAGQTWSDALKQLDDQTIERGDIVVTQERAKQLSQPPQTPRLDAKGRPMTAAQRAAADAAKPVEAKPVAASDPAAEVKTETEPGKRNVRAVGPIFVPLR
jgi:hypothetical protein